MKRICILAFLTLFISLQIKVKAQDISVKNDTMFGSIVAVDSSKITLNNIVTNNTANTVTLVWERTEDIPVGWTTAVCDNNLCYSFEVDNEVYSPIDSGLSGDLIVYFYPNDIVGSGKVTIQLYPQGGNPQDGISVLFFGEAWSVGTKENDLAKFSMYPNPVTNYLNIQFSYKGKHYVEVYNILGRKILKKEVQNDNIMRIPFSNLQRGMYIVMYKAQNGKIITKSISKR